MDDRTLLLTAPIAPDPATHSKKRILALEPDATLLTTLRAHLEQEGYAVTGTGDGDAVLSVARGLAPHLVILDLATSGRRGFDVYRLLRTEMHVPVIMLTAGTDEFDNVLALELGADDVLAKPFSVKELVARVRRRLRDAPRPIQLGSAESLVVGDIHVDPLQRKIWKGGRALSLTTKEFDLLAFLMRNCSRAVTRTDLLRYIWGYEGHGRTRTVDVHIGKLRSKIEDDPDRPVRITTVRGVGYRFT